MLFDRNTKMSLFKIPCTICGKDVYGYAVNKRGDVPIMVCGSPVCRTKHEEKKKFVKFNKTK